MTNNVIQFKKALCYFVVLCFLFCPGSPSASLSNIKNNSMRTVPYALQSLPGDIWLKIVDHNGRRDGLRRTCRKLMAIIPAVYRAELLLVRQRPGH